MKLAYRQNLISYASIKLEATHGNSADVAERKFSMIITDYLCLGERIGLSEHRE